MLLCCARCSLMASARRMCRSETFTHSCALPCHNRAAVIEYGRSACKNVVHLSALQQAGHTGTGGAGAQESGQKRLAAGSTSPRKSLKQQHSMGHTAHPGSQPHRYATHYQPASGYGRHTGTESRPGSSRYVMDLTDEPAEQHGRGAGPTGGVDREGPVAAGTIPHAEASQAAAAQQPNGKHLRVMRSSPSMQDTVAQGSPGVQPTVARTSPGAQGTASAQQQLGAQPRVAQRSPGVQATVIQRPPGMHALAGQHPGVHPMVAQQYVYAPMVPQGGHMPVYMMAPASMLHGAHARGHGGGMRSQRVAGAPAPAHGTIAAQEAAMMPVYIHGHAPRPQQQEQQEQQHDAQEHQQHAR